MNSELTEQRTEAWIFARLVETRWDTLSRDAAAYCLSLQFDRRDISRMNELSELARLGRLTSADQTELDSYIHVSNLQAVMQSKARQSLRALESERGVIADIIRSVREHAEGSLPMERSGASNPGRERFPEAVATRIRYRCKPCARARARRSDHRNIIAIAEMHRFLFLPRPKKL